ncbi:hypothetical protein SAMN05216319_3784 [Duganella sp. CF402]|uniref:ABC-three component system protein n=1 Tax=unclassified Duganella TaxID=2636909 RepID=UPI0008AA7D23|nr:MULTISPECIES: ABC-three component system protein [unclassified Duganella]RZT04433.1 hypothetical protein EV582_5321 [Duganella sp. BK701]SEM36578.1 hypothetical protein SAMN05216319_3784 [Duganella sp. CF402]
MSEQNDNVVTGDLVGGNKTENNFNFSSPLALGNSELTRLYIKLRQDDPDKDTAGGFCEQLQHYMTSTTDGDVRGLEAKLQESGRLDQLSVAKAMKESAFKAIMRRQTSSTAQRIFTIVLDELHTNFMLTATPMIQIEAGRAAIDQAILKVINDTKSILGENLLEITAKDLFSLIYFLGGNCHIRWDKC